MKGGTVTPEGPRRRLRKKTCIGGHRPSNQKQPDDIAALLAGAPGGKLHVSRDAYHDLPPNVQGAFKRGDPRIVVVDSEDHQSSAAAVAEASTAPRESWQRFRGAASSTTSCIVDCKQQSPDNML